VFSITKLIVLVAIIAAIFFAFKYISRIKAKRDTATRRAVPPRQQASGRFAWARRVFKAEDLVACPQCGSYVRSLKDHRCAETV